MVVLVALLPSDRLSLFCAVNEAKVCVCVCVRFAAAVIAGWLTSPRLASLLHSQRTACLLGWYKVEQRAGLCLRSVGFFFFGNKEDKAKPKRLELES